MPVSGAIGIRHAVERFAAVLEPRWLAIENVTSMRNWRQYDQWWKSLKAIGYHMASVSLSSERFGVPQSRRRLFVVGDRKQPPRLPDIPDAPQRTIADVIRDLKGNAWTAGTIESRKRAQPTMDRINRAKLEVGDKRDGAQRVCANQRGFGTAFGEFPIGRR